MAAVEPPSPGPGPDARWIRARAVLASAPPSFGDCRQLSAQKHICPPGRGACIRVAGAIRRRARFDDVWGDVCDKLGPWGARSLGCRRRSFDRGRDHRGWPSTDAGASAHGRNRHAQRRHARSTRRAALARRPTLRQKKAEQGLAHGRLSLFRQPLRASHRAQRHRALARHEDVTLPPLQIARVEAPIAAARAPRHRGLWQPPFP